MRARFALAIFGLVLMWSAAQAKGNKEKLSTPVFQDSGNRIAVEVKTVGASVSVLGSTVIAGHDIRYYYITNPDPVYRMAVSSGTLGAYETAYYLGPSTSTTSSMILQGDATFYLKMDTGAGSNTARILRTYNQ